MQFGSLAEIGPSAQNRAVLNQGLAVLRKVSPEAEELLRNRFEHQQDAFAVGNSLNVSESSIYYRQRQAVTQLSRILNKLEETANQEWQEKMLSRLQLPTYTTLVGVSEALARLLDVLHTRKEHFLIALVGLGGIGKTTLADQATRQIIKTTRFDEIAWITAKQTHLSSLGRLQVESSQPALTFPMLVGQLVNQFDLTTIQTSHLQKERLVKRYLQERACLVIIDNLETVSDYRSLLPELQKWQNPTKFILTSRYRLMGTPGVYTMQMKELSPEAAIQLLRQEAGRTGFDDLANADEDTLLTVYDVVGGNPLALKLMVGQLRFYSLPHVLSRYSDKTKSDSREDLFEYIYRDIWDGLADESKMILLALTQASETGFTFEHSVEVTELSESVLLKSLENLILLSLVDLAGNLTERRYRLHRLTEVFLLRMFAD